MLRTLAVVVGVLIAGVLGFGATLVALEQFSGKAPVDKVLEATRCEVELGPERCPGNPGFEPARKSRIFLDNWANAGSDVAACLKRASDVHAFCKSTSQVTARFYKGRQLIKIETRK